MKKWRNWSDQWHFWSRDSPIRDHLKRTIVWTMVWFGSDQRSFPAGKVWLETVLSALRAHTKFWAHISLIRGYFGLGWSDQRLLLSGMVWSEVTFVWIGLIGGHFQIAPQPGWDPIKRRGMLVGKCLLISIEVSSDTVLLSTGRVSLDWFWSIKFQAISLPPNLVKASEDIVLDQLQNRPHFGDCFIPTICFHVQKKHCRCHWN